MHSMVLEDIGNLLIGFIHFLSYYMVGSSHSVKHLDPVVIVMNIEFHDLVGAINLIVFEY